MSRSKVFVSYSHADARWLDALNVHLTPLENELDVWADTRIAAGQQWRQEIRTALQAAKIALLLASPEFLASRFITEHELPLLLRAAETDGLHVLVVHIRASLLTSLEALSTPVGRLREFQSLNSPRQPLAELSKPKRDRALAVMATQIISAARASAVRMDPRPYLERIREQTKWLDLRGIGARNAARVELDRVYTQLRVMSPAPGGATPGDHRGQHDHRTAPTQELRDVELRELLPQHDNIVVVGDPGAGKSTFLRFVALQVSRVLLGEEPPHSLARVGMWEEARPFPILIRLEPFHRYLSTKASFDCPPDCAEQFRLYLDFLSRGLPAGIPESFLRDRLTAGGCILLLDGLDEVAGDQARVRVGAIIDAVVTEGNGYGNRHIVTCRTRAYQGRSQLGPEFTRANLLEFNQQQIAAFVHEWSRALFQVGPTHPSDITVEAATQHEQELLAAIRAHPHVRPLTANPLLLTILAVVHWNRKKLPEQRADLYEAAVEYLLESRIEQSTHESTLRRDCLIAIARTMFEDQDGPRKTLGRGEAAAAVAPLLGLTDPKAAVLFVENEELYSGILVSRLEGEVEFWHPTFGEYLTATGLAWEPDYWDRIRDHLFEERWNEVVLLLAGCRRRQGLKYATDLIQRILHMDDRLPELARQVGLVGRILRDILPAGGNPAQGTAYDDARTRVLAIFEKGSEMTEAIRVEVGEALGQAGDPRISDNDDANRVRIPEGTFSMGAGDLSANERPVHRVTVSAFFMDVFPVTVLQFQQFAEAGPEGYFGEQYWSLDGWKWRRAARRTSPGDWDEQRRHRNRPVTWVSWYEASAYCRWLSVMTTRHVDLPTEAQWEYAARGSVRRTFPWGNEEPTDRHANLAMRLGRVTPVAIYPEGATPEGIQDLAGNVWEWCRDWFGPYEPRTQRDPEGLAQGKSRVLRGGAFRYPPFDCRSAVRHELDPGNTADNIGFRCVALSS